MPDDEKPALMPLEEINRETGLRLRQFATQPQEGAQEAFDHWLCSHADALIATARAAHQLRASLDALSERVDEAVTMLIDRCTCHGQGPHCPACEVRHFLTAREE